MRVLSSTYGSRGDVERIVELAVQPRTLGAEVRLFAPPDFAELLAGVGVPLVPFGRPVRLLAAADLPQHATEPVATRFGFVAAAEECDAPVAADVVPNVAPR
jgi:vancomycin aglycone glucosyltransferase